MGNIKDKNNQKTNLKYFLIMLITLVMIVGVLGEELLLQSDENIIITELNDARISETATKWNSLNDEKKITIWPKLEKATQLKIVYKLTDNERTELIKMLKDNERNEFVKLIITGNNPEKDIKVAGLEKATDIKYITNRTGENEKTFLRLIDDKKNEYVIELKFLSKGKVSSITFNEEHGFLYEFKDGTKIYPGVQGYFEQDDEKNVFLRFYGEENENARKLKIPSPSESDPDKLLEIDLTKTKEWEGSKISYEEGFLIISKPGDNSIQHKIPLTNLPEDFKEISFKKNTNNPNDDYGIFYYDNEENSNSVFVNDGSWIEKHGTEATAEEKAYGKWIVKAENKDKTKTIGYLYPGENKGNTFQIGIAKAGEKRDIELSGLHVWDNPKLAEGGKEGPHITALDKEGNQVSIFPTNKDKPIEDKYYAGFDPATSRIRGKMDLTINKANYPEFTDEDEIKDFTITIDGENDIVVTTNKEYENEKYKVLIMAPTKDEAPDGTITIGYDVKIPENYGDFSLKLDQDININFYRGNEITKTEVISNGKRYWQYSSGTKQEKVPRAGAQTLSGSGRVGNSEKGHWEYRTARVGPLGFERRGPFKYGPLTREKRIPVRWIPEGVSGHISDKVPLRKIGDTVTETGGDSKDIIPLPDSTTPIVTQTPTPPTRSSGKMMKTQNGEEIFVTLKSDGYYHDNIGNRYATTGCSASGSGCTLNLVDPIPKTTVFGTNCPDGNCILRRR